MAPHAHTSHTLSPRAAAEQCASTDCDPLTHHSAIRPRANPAFPTASDIPYPPPPYTPTVALHASTFTGPSPSAVGGDGVDGSSGPNSVNTNAGMMMGHRSVGVVLGAGLASVVLGLLAAGVIVWLKRRRVRTRVPAFFARIGNTQARGEALVVAEKASSGTVFVEWDEGYEVNGSQRAEYSLDGGEKWHAAEESGGQRWSGAGNWVRPTWQILEEAEEDDDLPLGGFANPSHGLSPRRYSSPAMCDPANDTTRTVYSKHASLPPLQRENSLYIQQQKAAEIAQMTRMKIIRDDSMVFAASASSQNQQTVLQSLGIVYHDQEVDIATTPMAAIQPYAFSSTPSSPTLPATDLADVNGDGKEIKALELSTSSSQDITAAILPESHSEEMSLTSCGSGSSMAETEIEDTVTEVRTARRVVISLCTLPGASTTDVPRFFVSAPSVASSSGTISSSAGSSTSLDASLRAEAEISSFALSDFPTPPPMLSPIMPSYVSLSTEIEQGLEERVVA